MKIKKLAWIGLGHMGTPMAMNLANADFDISVYNRTAEKMKPFSDKGIKTNTSLVDTIKNSEVVFIMLSDDKAVSSAFEQIWNLDIRGKLFVNMSTISPNLAVELHGKCKTLKADYLDAPVSGSVKPATDGTLLILVGGEGQAYETAIPYFEKLGKLSLLLGNAGLGSKAKLAINYYMSVVIDGLAETVLFAEKNGVNKEAMMLIVNESACGSGMSKMKTPAILQDDYPAAFPLKHMHKDLGLAKDLGLNTDLIEAVSNVYNQAMENGDGDKDLMAVIRSVKI